MDALSINRVRMCVVSCTSGVHGVVVVMGHDDGTVRKTDSFI